MAEPPAGKGGRRSSRSESSTTGAWVKPASITCSSRSSCSRTAALMRGWAWPRMLTHQGADRVEIAPAVEVVEPHARGALDRHRAESARAPSSACTDAIPPGGCARAVRGFSFPAGELVQRGRELVDVLGAMRRRERDAQPGAPRRHGRRADRRHPDAAARAAPRRARAPPGVADDERLNGGARRQRGAKATLLDAFLTVGSVLEGAYAGAPRPRSARGSPSARRRGAAGSRW